MEGCRYASPTVILFLCHPTSRRSSQSKSDVHVLHSQRRVFPLPTIPLLKRQNDAPPLRPSPESSMKIPRPTVSPNWSSPVCWLGLFPRRSGSALSVRLPETSCAQLHLRGGSPSCGSSL